MIDAADWLGCIVVAFCPGTSFAELADVVWFSWMGAVLFVSARFDNCTSVGSFAVTSELLLCKLLEMDGNASVLFSARPLERFALILLPVYSACLPFA